VPVKKNEIFQSVAENADIELDDEIDLLVVANQLDTFDPNNPLEWQKKNLANKAAIGKSNTTMSIHTRRHGRSKQRFEEASPHDATTNRSGLSSLGTS
jgi:hypothetical protein